MNQQVKNMNTRKENKFWTDMTIHVDKLLKFKRMPLEDKQDIRQEVLLDLFLCIQSNGNVMSINQAMMLTEIGCRS